MLPFVLVLLIASNALAAPYVEVYQSNINEVAPLKGNGKLISRALTDNALELVDGGDLSVNLITSTQILNDLANRNDRKSQAAAIGGTTAVLTQLANGIPGNACAAANLIDAYARNRATAGGAINNFIQSLVSGIDSIAQLAVNPNAVRFSSGSRGNCNGGGRVYSFESAWDAILSNANSGSASLVNEQYCVAKRLYNAFDVRSNNVAAFLTAANLPPVIERIQGALEPLASFLAAAASGKPGSTTSAAKQALLSSR